MQLRVNDITEAHRYMGRRLWQVRMEHSYSLEKVAELAGCDREIIEWTESGVMPRPCHLVQIALALKVNPAWLQFGEPFAHRELPNSGKPNK